MRGDGGRSGRKITSLRHDRFVGDATSISVDLVPEEGQGSPIHRLYGLLVSTGTVEGSYSRTPHPRKIFRNTINKIATWTLWDAEK